MAADQDLAILGLSTEPGGEVAYGADRGVAGAVGKPIWPRVASVQGRQQIVEDAGFPVLDLGKSRVMRRPFYC